MPIRNGIIAVLLAAIIPGVVIVDPAFAQLSCSDVKYGNPNYHDVSVPPAVHSHVLSDASYGSITFGAPLKSIEARLGEKATADNNNKECDFVRFKKLPGIYFMVENGIVTRADVTSPQIKNTLLISIGTTLKEVKRRYPNVEIEPQKYLENGHYLIFKSTDRKRAILFEEDGGKVTGVRAGMEPSVEYVEGCQ